ncbi:multidrug resistance protein [Aureimonas endophytica]|uniref:Multidrug resistance protein n=1 Tax=Aureimonas endophytica TaxID=2027858 RepID=A0A917E2Y5_9HYPH|nr:efflux RND transporter periplasmic adaptor subunit [Aureimonas endophytica]GGD97684.1 multidrug resistance protein [Aureimonas endophytica]
MPTVPPRRPVRRAVIALVLVAALGGGAYAVWRHFGPGGAPAEAAAKAPDKVPVTVETAESRDYPVYRESLGTVEALNTVTVRAQVSGKITKVAFHEGQIVKAGDLLVEIDPRPFQAALDQAEARLQQDQASLADAQTILERYRTLSQQQITTRQQFETQQATVNQLNAQIEGDKAAIDNARTQLDYTAIRAPIAGRVGFRLADLGNLVGPSDTGGIVTIQQVTPIAVVFTEPERELAALTASLGEGRPEVAALTTAGDRELAKGSLRLLDNTVDAASGTVRLKAVFDNEKSVLWPGMSVTTRLLLKTEPQAVVISELAVQRGPDGLFVYVVGGDGKAEMRKVTTAETYGGLTMVREGVRPGEKLVVEGQYRVKPGTLLDPKEKERKAAGDKIASAAEPGQPAATTKE